ncbi:MAG: hypothetical protein ABIP48_15585 [Planctomycetota bacterium]
MKRNRWLNVVLSVAGVGALLAYVVACRPSWSPDGTKLLFPCGQGDVTGIVLLDKTTGESRLIFQVPKGYVAWCQWDRKGEYAIVACAVVGVGESDELQVHLVPVDPKKPHRSFEIDSAEGTPGLPFPEVNGCLFLGGKSLVRLDLKTGQVERRELDDEEDEGEDDEDEAEDGEEEEEAEILLVSQGDRIYYCTKDEEDYEIGTVDPKDLSLKPLAELSRKDVGEIVPLMGVARDGSAVAVGSKKEGQNHLHVIRADGFRKSLPLELPNETYQLGNLEWSADGKTIYAALAKAEKDPDLIGLGVAEITVASGKVRQIPVLEEPGGDGGPDSGIWILDFQIALSPDGKTIAAAPGYLEESQDEKKRAVYLVDLTRPGRDVTRMPVSLGEDSGP